MNFITMVHVQKGYYHGILVYTTVLNGIYMILQGTSNITMVPDFDIYHGTENVLQKHTKKQW